MGRLRFRPRAGAAARSRPPPPAPGLRRAASTTDQARSGTGWDNSEYVSSILSRPAIEPRLMGVSGR